MIFRQAAARRIACCLVFLLLPVAASAQKSPWARVNQEYRLINPQPADVTLRRVPALLGDDRMPHVRIYYTLEKLDELERLLQQVYRSHHLERLPMTRPAAMSQWSVVCVV
jgi:hypothetical protein